MAEHPSWDEIRAQLSNAREVLAADQRRRSNSADPAEHSASGDSHSAPFAATPLETSMTLTRLEALARRRRIDWQIAAARTAMKHGRVVEARAALSEIHELDPSNPEIISLSLEIEAAAHARRSWRKGPAVAAVASFAAIVLLATRSGRPVPEPRRMRELLTAIPFPISAPFETVPQIASTAFVPEEVTEPSPPEIIADKSVEADRVERLHVFSSPAPREVPPVANAVDIATVPTDTPVPVQPVSTAGVVIDAPAPVSIAAAAPVVAAPTPPAPAPVPTPTIDNERSIRQALERYRAAYERLDARSAQQVWPAVDELALARAFTGLRSQSLTFDQCDVHVRGSAATASCVGSARYVPKVGSQQPRVESRLWDFTLRQTGNEWKIETARVDR